MPHPPPLLLVRTPLLFSRHRSLARRCRCRPSSRCSPPRTPASSSAGRAGGLTPTFRAPPLPRAPVGGCGGAGCSPAQQAKGSRAASLHRPTAVNRRRLLTRLQIDPAALARGTLAAAGGGTSTAAPRLGPSRAISGHLGSSRRGRRRRTSCECRVAGCEGDGADGPTEARLGPFARGAEMSRDEPRSPEIAAARLGPFARGALCRHRAA